MKLVLFHRSPQKIRIPYFVFLFFIFCVGEKALAAGSNDDSLHASFNTSGTPFWFQPDYGVSVNERQMKAGLLYDVENAKIVWQKEMNTVFPIASLTKMMVALLIVEDVRDSKITWDDKVRWTKTIYYWVKRKKVRSTSDVTYSLYDLFKNAMIASNNEASEQLARYSAEGDLDAFIQRMNLRARELGMNSTYYGNPTGLPSYSRMYDNSSTPTDLLILTLEMLKFKEIIDVTRMDFADIKNGNSTTTIRNHNRLTIDYKGEVDGMKTGYTRRAGFCLVASSYKCDHRLISIVLGSPAPVTRNDLVKDMIDDYYTAIGLDKLGPFCAAPPVLTEAGLNNNEDEDASEGAYVYKTHLSYVTHVVKKGEFLNGIAQKYKCQASQIKIWNSLKSSQLRPGQRLTIRAEIREKVWQTREEEQQEKSDPKPADTEKSSGQTGGLKPAFIFYTIQSGDTLFSISQRHDCIPVDELKKLNEIIDESCLVPGSKIKVPVKG